LLTLSSGVLIHGYKDSVKYPINIDDCYRITLTSDATKQLDEGHLDSPRQRNEFKSPHAYDGEKYEWSWKSYLSSKTGTSNSFFHLWQIVSRGGTGGPRVTMDAVKDTVSIKDITGQGCPSSGCPSIALSSYTDKTMINTIQYVQSENLFSSIC